MKRAFQLTLIVAVALAMMTPSMAQEKKKKKGKNQRDPKQAVMNLIKNVELTDEQKPKVEAIAKELGPKLRKSYQDKMAILTADQKKAMNETRKKNAKDKVKRAEANKALVAALKLSDEQKKKWETLGKANNDMRAAVLKKIATLLTDEQKKKVPGLNQKKGGKGKKKGKKKDTKKEEAKKKEKSDSK